MVDGVWFDSTGTRLVADVKTNDGMWCYIIDGVPQKEYVGEGGLSFSPSGRHYFSYGARSASGIAVLVYDGVEIAQAEHVGRTWLGGESPDELIWVEEAGTKQTLWVGHGGQFSAEEIVQRNILYDPVSRQAGAVVKDGDKWRVFFGDAKSPAMDEILGGPVVDESGNIVCIGRCGSQVKKFVFALGMTECRVLE